MNNLIKKHKNEIIIALFGILTLLFCTKNSPLFYFNDWVDVNSFFTVGKAMFNGKVLYKDIFEQKGPVLYLIHGIGYLISNTTFIGVFIIEAMSFSVLMIYCYKLLKLFYSDTISLIGTAILPFFILSSKYFCHGGSAEEYILCLQMVALYHIMYYFKTAYYEKTINLKHIFVNGSLFSLTFLIKYNIAVFWVLPILTMIISMLINRQYKDVLKSVAMFLLGCSVIIAPILIYFIANNALADFINIYFIFNVKFYTGPLLFTGSVTFLIYIFKNLMALIAAFKIEYIAILIGIFYFIIFVKGIKWWQRILIAGNFGIVFSTIFYNGTSHPYYSMGISIFIVFMLMAVCKIIELIKLPQKGFAVTLIMIVMFGITLFRNPYHSVSRVFSKENTTGKVQLEFAEIMNKEQNPTLLNYGFLDGGFFTTADIIPNIRFFQRQNMIFETYDLHKSEHLRYIKEKEVDFIVRRIKKSYYTGKLEEVPYLDENYMLIAENQQHFEGYDFLYFLYKVKS
ncbi:MAG: hypothetical protein KAQ68_05820 [Clostridiales bacterium]|nr:hypothetical protein [Clostridiales bacterium]